MNINPSNIKDKSNENIFSPSCNLNVSSSSKGKPQDELDTNKHVSSHELSKFLTSKEVTVSSPLQRPVLQSGPPEAKLSQLGDINNNKNNVSSSSNKEPGWEWDTIKGRGWRKTGNGKRVQPPTNTNVMFITDPELHKKLYGDYEHLWINFSKPPWKRKLHSPHISAGYEDAENIGYDYDSDEDLFDVGNIDKVTDDVSRLSIDSFNLSQDHISDNHSNIYIAKEEQSRNDFHSHHIVILNTENLEAGNRYDPYGSSSECSSECSYNHKSKNKK